MSRVLLAIVAIALLLAVVRFFVHSHEAVFSAATGFKTAAHAFEFGILGYSIGKKDWLAYQGVFWGLVVVELVAFWVSGAEIVIQ